MAFTIEVAQQNDAKTIACLLEEIKHYYNSNEIATFTDAVARVEKFVFGTQPVAHVLLAKAGEDIAGMAAYSFLWPAGTMQSLFLKELYVCPKYRRQGIGKLFIKRLSEIALENNCRRIDWSAERNDEAANSFYRKIGAHPVEKLFYRIDMTNA